MFRYKSWPKISENPYLYTSKVATIPISLEAMQRKQLEAMAREREESARRIAEARARSQAAALASAEVRARLNAMARAREEEARRMAEARAEQAAAKAKERLDARRMRFPIRKVTIDPGYIQKDEAKRHAPVMLNFGMTTEQAQALSEKRRLLDEQSRLLSEKRSASSDEARKQLLALLFAKQTIEEMQRRKLAPIIGG